MYNFHLKERKTSKNQSSQTILKSKTKITKNAIVKCNKPDHDNKDEQDTKSEFQENT